jgi:hypothetical protein
LKHQVPTGYLLNLPESAGATSTTDEEDKWRIENVMQYDSTFVLQQISKS